MARRRGTMGQSWPLTTGNNDDPTLALGKPTSFFCNTVPDRAPGGLAYLLSAVILTIYGSVIQPASGGTAIPQDELKGALIQSVNWINAWHGTVLSSDHVLGANLPIVEFVGGGYEYPAFQKPPVPAAVGTYPIKITVALPASNTLLGDLMWDTSQLALMFQTSQIKLNVADGTLLNTLSTGATFGALTARMSAMLEPTSQLTMGTPVENILHQTVAGSNSNQVQIKGFGTDTLMNGVLNKGGVLWLGELTIRNNQGGVFSADTITQFTMPWRNQQQQNHIEAIYAQMRRTLPNWREQALPSNLPGGDSNFASYPFTNSGNDQQTTGAGNAQTDLFYQLYFPIVHPGDDVQLTDCQTADSDQSYFLTNTGGFAAGSHLIQAMYARAFNDAMKASFIGLVTRGGDASLARYVLGPSYASASLKQLAPTGRHTITSDMMTYQPFAYSL